jgi:hypothetical protein
MSTGAADADLVGLAASAVGAYAANSHAASAGQHRSLVASAPSASQEDRTAGRSRGLGSSGHVEEEDPAAAFDCSGNAGIVATPGCVGVAEGMNRPGSSGAGSGNAAAEHLVGEQSKRPATAAT